MKNLLLSFIIIICLVGCTEKKSIEQVYNNETQINDTTFPQKEPSGNTKMSLFEMVEYAENNPNRDFSQYDTYSNLFDTIARVGTKENPIKIGDVGLVTSIGLPFNESGDIDPSFSKQYPHNIFIKVTRRLNNDEVYEIAKNKMEFPYFSPDATLQGVLCEIDYNQHPMILYGIKKNVDFRDTVVHASSIRIEDGKYSFLDDDIEVIPYDENNLEDNRICIIWSISKDVESDGILKMPGYTGHPIEPDDYFYSYFEI